MLTESKRLKPKELVRIDGSDQELRLLERREAGIWRAQPVPPADAHQLLARYGRPPLPPYIKRKGRGNAECGTRNAERQEPEAQARDLSEAEGRGGSEEERGRRGDKATKGQGEEDAAAAFNSQTESSSDVDRYQTIYARSPGAVAAPTAGLHFTPAVFDALKAAGFEKAFVTLHVGVGTFAPVRVEDLADHPMHAEWYECPDSTAAAVNSAREQGRPIVAVGTTSVRVLESCATDAGQVTPGTGWTRLFIYPPYQFKIIDALLTNFHLPESTLLAMIFALAGRERILGAYQEAIEKEYRFYSYGDAMLVV